MCRLSWKVGKPSLGCWQNSLGSHLPGCLSDSLGNQLGPVDLTEWVSPRLLALLATRSLESKAHWKQSSPFLLP